VNIPECVLRGLASNQSDSPASENRNGSRSANYFARRSNERNFPGEMSSLAVLSWHILKKSAVSHASWEMCSRLQVFNL
jgi:hypothetical protein